MTTFKDRFHEQQERQAAAYADWLPGWRNRRTRRRVAVAWLIAALTTIGLGTVAGSPDSTVLLVWMVLLLITIMLQLLNKVLTNNMGERSARLLDERELALRGRSSYVGFLVATWSMIAAAVAFAATPIGSLPLAPFVVLMSLGMLAANTPSALLAWQLPDDEPDPIAEGDSRG
ncbi:hypothetical protein [Kutzneria sp. 744]|uniref:hypothetical protein n=1 Tax=Kutzneria sp. (strain 744) TaxID=345341 RepID=UPI0003EEA93E|nr:hypothetical protein [Kutzneria sp. 744]EWM14259.1 hypothetical protein KUTG_04563 [Kutzneria sp. 744]